MTTEMTTETQEPVTGEVIYMKDFLTRRFNRTREKAQTFYERAVQLNVRGELNDDPYSAPLLSLHRQELEKMKPISDHYRFIVEKEQEIAAKERAINHVDVTKSQHYGVPNGVKIPMP